MSNVVLALEGVRKTFPGVVALDNVDFELRAGEVHALLGENGAGKSTLIKVLTGVYQKDAGEIVFQGASVMPRSSGDAQKLGISTVYQEVNLLPNLTVAHNIYLGREPRRLGLVHWREMNRRATELLKRFDVSIDVTQPLSHYSVAVQQLVAIARGVDMSAKVLVLDEPTASLDSREVEKLFVIMRQLKGTGIGIVFVTHFLDQVYAISDRISVLRNGCKIGCFATADLPRAQLIEHMLGKALQSMSEATQTAGDDVSRETVLGLKRVGVTRSVHDISLEVSRGEAVGLAGLLGSGRTEVCRAVFGIDTLNEGALYFRGSSVTPRKPADAIAQGVALCPEDRKAEGVIGPLTIRENIVLALQAREGWWRPIAAQKQKALADRAIAELHIATPDCEKPVEQLSGGNQQKVILGRWLATDPALLILDEPTRGIDIGAHAEIIKLIRRLCGTGMALLVTSSELEELVAFSHTVVVMRDRRKVAELRGDAITEDTIMQAIADAGTTGAVRPGAE